MSMRWFGALCAATLLVHPAEAVPLSVGAAPEGVGGCNVIETEVLRWTPRRGPPATYIVERYLQRPANLLVVVGVDGTGVWTAEVDAGSDACACSELFLVHTAFDGKRVRHAVGVGEELAASGSRLPSDRAGMLRLIFALRSVPWGQLRHEYSVTYPPRNADGSLKRYTGWFVQIRVRNHAPVRYGVLSEPQNCWCFQRWRGYPVKPSPHPSR